RDDSSERVRLSEELRVVAQEVMEHSGIDPRSFARSKGAEESDIPVPDPDFEKFRSLRIDMIEAQRRRLLELQKEGTYSSAALT
ncbi:hypothetical protein ACC691_40190, partial [Rhizobium johnstonii]|uniref:hypothetical protein n=1 Tax=Rhizobium johnstonii TaxID=3019933 RepID=UPI003F9BAFCA